MRRKFVAGNWKMNMTIAEASAAVEAFVQKCDLCDHVDVVICPAYTALFKVHELVKRTHIRVGAQDVFWLEKGAFTGSISPSMIAEAGASYCIVGHSETRGRFGKLEIDPAHLGFFAETDETINLKIKSLLYRDIHPILCVGETLSEREAGQTDHLIAEQIKHALAGIEGDELYELVVAYEPVWAIGTGKTCDALEANRVCSQIRRVLAQLFSEEMAQHVRILYGGSVKAANAKEIFGQPEIDGGLVGGASLDPHEFSEIVRSA